MRYILSFTAYLALLSIIFELNYLHLLKLIIINFLLCLQFIYRESKEEIAFLLSLIGAIGGMILIRDKIVDFFFVRSYLNLNRYRKTIFILTSRATRDSHNEKKYETGVAQVRASTTLMHYIKTLYKDIEPQINFSTFSDLTLDGNLILLGGPAKNPISGSVIAALESHIGNRLHFQDSGSKLYIKYGDEEFKYSAKENIEYALVAIWENILFTSGKRDARLLLCCGLTGSGTEAAAKWMVRNALSLNFDKRSVPEIGGLNTIFKPIWSVIYRNKLKNFDNIMYILKIRRIENCAEVIEITRYKSLLKG